MGPKFHGFEYHGFKHIPGFKMHHGELNLTGTVLIMIVVNRIILKKAGP